MSATKELLAREKELVIVQDQASKYTRFCHKEAGSFGFGDPTGISCEEGELLYGLVRVVRPLFVLETGTNIGISTRYIALALEHNGDGGRVVTIEHDKCVADFARMTLSRMFTNVEVCEGDSLSAILNRPVDLLWLDTEPSIRYFELTRFFASVVPGGFICIHDLWELDCPMFGGLPKSIGDFLKSGKLSVVRFRTVHGVSVFQKAFDEDVLLDVMSGSYKFIDLEESLV
ncbi:MAG: class I SAM-dependent methyltransferase [Candidatus Methanomethylicaceae archaeon]